MVDGGRETGRTVVSDGERMCEVRLGLWQGFERGLIPSIPHLVAVDKLGVAEKFGSGEYWYIEDMMMLVCHGIRNGSILKTLDGFDLVDAVRGLRSLGHRVDGLVACDNIQSGQIKVNEFATLQPPIIYCFGSQVIVGVSQENGGVEMGIAPAFDGGTIAVKPFLESRLVEMQIKPL